jgi:hypothetical protein
MKVKQSCRNKNDYRSDIYDAKVRIAVTRWELGKVKEVKLKNDECDNDECEGA